MKINAKRIYLGCAVAAGTFNSSGVDIAQLHAEINNRVMNPAERLDPCMLDPQRLILVARCASIPTVKDLKPAKGATMF